jgi:hypothetical protein
MKQTADIFERLRNGETIPFDDPEYPKLRDVAFSECSSLTSIAIPDGVNSVGAAAFAGCSGLKSATLGNGVTSIGYGAFYDCSRLTDVYFKGNVPQLPGGEAFSKPSVIYYKPGTRGWTNPWDGRPTKEWIE